MKSKNAFLCSQARVIRNKAHSTAKKPVIFFAEAGMLPRVTSVRHLRDHQLEVTFSDNTVAELDFYQRITGRGGVFRPLESVEFFAQVAVDREGGTLYWPNGVDFCPDVLYAQATGKL